MPLISVPTMLNYFRKETIILAWIRAHLAGMQITRKAQNELIGLFKLY
jgi:hypothetical protein